MNYVCMECPETRACVLVSLELKLLLLVFKTLIGMFIAWNVGGLKIGDKGYK